MEHDETRRILLAGLDAWQISCTDHQIDQMLRYASMLVEWNETRMNLTRLTSPQGIAVGHFLDSLSILRVITIPHSANLLDVGSGAGFPSLPLKILRPDISVTLLEATAKKLTFCKAVAEALDMKNIRFVHGRAETGAPGLPHRAFDFVTARAVAPLETLAGWCEPYLKPRSGVIIALKGSRAPEELQNAVPVLGKLRLRAKPTTVTVPGSEKEHVIVLCRQVPPKHG